MRPHYNLDVWKRAMEVVDEVYRLTARFPSEERYVLASQIRRTAISVPSNIAEGAAGRSASEFARFLNIAKGSLSELETQLLIAVRQSYINSDHNIFSLLEQVSSQLHRLHKSILNNKPNK